MKKIVIVLLVAIAILAIVPRFVGATAEDKIRELYQKFGQHPSWDFEIVDYNRGWFSSTLKVDIGLVIPGIGTSAKDQPKLSITHDLQHGPVLWKSGGLGFGLVDIAYGVELKDTQVELGEYKQAMSVTSRMEFDGSNTSILKINPFTINNDGTDVKILAGEFKTDFDVSGYVGLNGDWEGMIVQGENGTDLEVSDLSARMDQSSITGEAFGPNALFEGDMSVTLKSVKVTGGSDTANVENISLTSTSKFNGDVANFDVFLGFAKASISDQEFTDAVYDITFENVSKDAILEMQRIFSGNDAGADPTLALQNLQEVALPKLLEKGPVLKINRIGVKTASGEISSSATLSIDQDKYDPDNMMSLMMAVDAVASGFAPEAFFSNLGLGSDIEMLVQQNLLVKDGDKLKFDASFKDGQAILNGTPMPLGM